MSRFTFLGGEQTCVLNGSALAWSAFSTKLPDEIETTDHVLPVISAVAFASQVFSDSVKHRGLVFPDDNPAEVVGDVETPIET